MKTKRSLLEKTIISILIIFFSAVIYKASRLKPEYNERAKYMEIEQRLIGMLECQKDYKKKNDKYAFSKKELFSQFPDCKIHVSDDIEYSIQNKKECLVSANYPDKEKYCINHFGEILEVE